MTSTSAGREPSPELLPCPWCGDIPAMPEQIGTHHWPPPEHAIYSVDCCRSHTGATPEEAIEAWNRRLDAIDGIEQGKGVGEPPEQSQADHPGLLREGHLPQGETRAHCGSGGRESGIETRSPTSSSPQSIARGPDQELREAAQRLIRYLDNPFVKNSALSDAYMLPVRIGDLRALCLALSGTTKEVSPEEEEPATCWCPGGVAHDPDCPDYKKKQAGASESSTSLGASGCIRPVGHGPSGTPAVGDNGVPVAPGSSAEANAASPAPAVSGEPRTTRKEGIPHELATEIRRAAANLANDYEMGERPCCADLARRIARGIRKLDLEAFAKASGEPRRGIPLTRVEVIDHRADSETFGRAFVAWDVAMELSYQDHGRTLKVFVDDKGALPNNPGEQAASASGANASNAESAQDGASPAGIPREPSEQAVRAAALALNNFNSDKYPWVEGSNWSVVWRDLTAALKAAYAVDSVAPAPTSEGPPQPKEFIHDGGADGIRDRLAVIESNIGEVTWLQAEWLCSTLRSLLDQWSPPPPSVDPSLSNPTTP